MILGILALVQRIYANFLALLELCYLNSSVSQYLPLQAGSVAVFFFRYRGRVFSFEGDDYKELKHDDETGSRLERWYTKGIKKAVRAVKAWREEREEREERQDSKKPYPYKYIKSNYPIGENAVLLQILQQHYAFFKYYGKI